MNQWKDSGLLADTLLQSAEPIQQQQRHQQTSHRFVTVCKRFKYAPFLGGWQRKKLMSGGQTRAYPHIIYKWTSNWLHVYKQQMPDKTDTEHGTQNTE